jgi:hypothetical protein
VRQAPGTRLPVQVQMNDNAAQFRKEVSVRFTLRASIIEKNLAFGFSATARRSLAETVLCHSSHSCYRADVSMGRQASHPF